MSTNGNAQISTNIGMFILEKECKSTAVVRVYPGKEENLQQYVKCMSLFPFRTAPTLHVIRDKLMNVVGIRVA